TLNTYFTVGSGPGSTGGGVVARYQTRCRGLVHPTMETRSSVPPADLLPVQRQATPIFRFLKLTVVPLIHVLCQIKVDGREHIPADRNYVLIANHLNWLDSFAILATF